ncbi:GTP-binding protein REM 2 isoform X3 [Phalacrocorax carbo]|uniref:GTP-binding protein REM 2 isoform X3 n=1 Tax=Phalacrocorax carbo TaxID=9209 RepID=UPI003119E5FB
MAGRGRGRGLAAGRGQRRIHPAEPPRERRLRVDGAPAALVLYDDDEEVGAWPMLMRRAGRTPSCWCSRSATATPSRGWAGGRGGWAGGGPPPLAAPLILVGNKSDLARARQVTPREVRGLAAVLGCRHLETSAALRHRTEELFEAAVRQARLHRRRRRREEEEEEEGGEEGEGGDAPPRRRRSLTGRAKRFFAGLVPLARQRSKSCSDLSAL